MDIIWHRDDIRVSDNVAVSESRNAVPLYVFDTRILEFASNRRVKWIRENVRSLKSDYRERDADLVVRVGKAPEVILDIVGEFNADRVFWNKSYTRLGRSRDKAVKEALESEDVDYGVLHDKVLHEPESIFTNKGTPYSVFTYYHKKWKDRDKDTPRTEPNQLHSFSDRRGVPSVENLGFEQPSISLPRPGTDSARDALEEFINEDINSYGDERDIPSESGTSRISPYLSYGVIGVREVWRRTEKAKRSGDVESVEDFQEQLAWRDFYNQVIYHNPELVKNNYKDYENPIEWRDDDEELQKWKDGRTGYPIVDAGMRQLKQEGWMHNRVRMIVASFLTKDLLIDWREGYKWFRKMLIDHNTANDNGGWQWAASTGTDAQPYFRIFNPMTQGERFDEQAEYIKSYVPELQNVEPSTIHDWNEISTEKRQEVAPGYVKPIVNHSQRREKALDMFKKARGEEND